MHFMVKSMAAVALLCSAAVHAQGGYFGGVFGVMSTDIEGDSPLNAGVRAGYRWGTGWGVEGEYTDSVVDGEYEFENSWISANFDYSISTLALYGTYRSQGDVYFKGKLGLLKEEVRSASDTGTSIGLGAGFNLSESANIELEYTLIEEDVDFWSGSLVYHF